MSKGTVNLILKLFFILLIATPLAVVSCVSQKKLSQEVIEEEPLPAIDTEYYAMVEKPAAFQDGDIRTFVTHLSKTLKYPAYSLKNKQQGTVFVQFGIDWYGHVRESTILKSSGYKTLDNAVLKAVNASPVWEPARIKTQAVGQLFMLQIKFDAKTRKVEIK